jgi:putative colanic acid biosynthesis UDP-glucose lipid carrier transferase
MRRFNIFFPVIFVICEAIIISFVTSLMHYLTFSNWSLYNTIIILFWLATVIYSKSYNIGRGVNYINTIKLALKSIFILFSFVAIGNLFVEYYTFSIKSIFFALAIFTLSILSSRVLTHFILDSYRSYGGNITNVAIFGYDKMGKNFYKTLKQYPHLGYRSNGIFSLKTKKGKITDIPNLGSLNIFYKNYNQFQEIIISTKIPYSIQKDLIDFCDKKFIPVKLLPELVNYEFKNFFIKKLYNIPVIDVNVLPLDLWYNKLLKRIFDVLFSLFILIFFVSWMYIIFGIIIKFQSKGPVLFVQRRHGLGGNVFNCYKFRSMILNNQEDTKFADNSDSRLTKFGKFLRVSALDEMPQFINVLFGDMSVVGPRPHPIKLNDKFSKKVEKFTKRHQFKPGITGLAQTRGFRGKIYGFYDMSSRVRLDRYYFKNWSILFDLKICFNTIYGILRYSLK